MGKCTTGTAEGQLIVVSATGNVVPGYIHMSFHPYQREMEKARNQGNNH